ncbi:MAG: glycoside hydrolase family 9 protein [Ruminococcus sp.]|jgi:endoglucanase|nr:glycoside hydrolase family 9 protein [Ruminococcus sp.]
MTKSKFLKASMSALTSSALIIGTVVPVMADGVIGEGKFDQGKGLPWHICESGPATTMNFNIKDGSYNITIINPGGLRNGGESKWDCQFRHRGLTLAVGHSYEISYDLWVDHTGWYTSKIGNYAGTVELWHNDMIQQPRQDIGGDPNRSDKNNWGWGGVIVDSSQLNKWTTHTGRFECQVDGSSRAMNDDNLTMDEILPAEWCFQFGGAGEYSFNVANPGSTIETGAANNPQVMAPDPNPLDCFPSRYSEGETVNIKFDNMVLTCTTCGTTGPCNYQEVAIPDPTTERSTVRVNQVGYYTNLNKKATALSDSTTGLPFSIKTAAGEEVFTGTSEPYDNRAIIGDSTQTTADLYEGKAVNWDGDSGQNVHILDFSQFVTAGEYYIEFAGGKSYNFEIGDDVYGNMFRDATNYFYQNRSGIPIESTYMPEWVDENGVDYYKAYGGDISKLTHLAGHNPDEAGLNPNDDVDLYPTGGVAVDTQPTSGNYTAVDTDFNNEPDVWIMSSYNPEANYFSNWVSAPTAEDISGADETITATYGWYDAGDHGKYVVNGGVAVWTLLNLYERAAKKGGDAADEVKDELKMPEDNNGIADLLDEAAYEVDFMMDMVVPASGTKYSSKYAGLVFHKLHDHKWTGLGIAPNEDTPDNPDWGCQRMVKPPTTAAAYNLAANAAQLSRLLTDAGVTSAVGPKGTNTAASYLAQAEATFKVAYDLQQAGTVLYAPMDQAIGGGPYGDNNVTDDCYWAAAELWLATGDSYYKDIIDKGYNTGVNEIAAFTVPYAITGGESQSDKGSFTSFNWGNTGTMGNLSMALNPEKVGETAMATLESTIAAAADKYVEKENQQGYGIPYRGAPFTDPINSPGLEFEGYEWGSNSFVINNIIVMAYAYDLTGDVTYMNGAARGMDYILGTNALDFSYVTGYGDYALLHPHHRFWAVEISATKYTYAPPGTMSGGANKGMQDPYIQGMGYDRVTTPSQLCFIDSAESWSTNEITINWNAPFAWGAYFMQTEAPLVGEVQPKPDPGTEPTPEPTPAPTDPTDPTPAPTDPSGGESVLRGDVDLDKAVKIADLVALCKHVVGVTGANLTGSALLAADCDVNGSVEAADTLELAKFIVKKILSFADPIVPDAYYPA